MFTFGREHELQAALRRHKDPAGAHFVVNIINSIHDFIDGTTTASQVESCIRQAFIEGKRGIWEAAGNWLLKLELDHPTSEALWFEFASHVSADVRFRVACHLPDLNQALAAQLHTQLTADKSRRVRNQANAKWDYCVHPEMYN